MSFLSSGLSQLRSGYAQLSGPQGQPQSATDAIDKLADRLAKSESPEDRRTALLGVKGLSRDWKADVGLAVMPTLLGILERDAAEDTETAKIVLETLNVLCEVDEPAPGHRVRRVIILTGLIAQSREPSAGLRNTDRFLGSDKPLHSLLSLLRQQHFYVRYFSLQLLGTLLSARPEPVQAHVLVAPGGLGRLVEVLEDKREIVRNEGLLLLISLASTNADIQKIVAFEGAFDKLFNIIDLEGGISSGGIVVQDCLAGIVGLLRYNVSNQNYFRETSCIPRLPPLLGFPPTSALSESTSAEAQQAALQGFATQYWSDQKTINADLVLSIARCLIGGAGEGRSANQKALLSIGLTRCFAELALASNAPSSLKAQAMLALADAMRQSPQSQDMFGGLSVSPLIPVVAEDAPPNAEPDWQRAEPVPAVLALVAMAVQGDPGLGDYAASMEGLRARAAAVSLLEAYTAGNPDAQVSIVSSMSSTDQTAGAILLSGLRALPPPGATGVFDSHAPLFSSLMLACLLRNTESCKRLARELSFGAAAADPDASVDDERFGLVHAVVGDLMLAQREQANCAANPSAAASERMTDWSRVQVGYLVLLCVWMWESPRSIREFLSEQSNVQVLVQPVAQASGVDSLVQGLCALLLSIVYEYNREPGPVTRATLHPILTSRVGPDQFVSRIARLREDPRFKNVGPDILERATDAEADEGLEDGFWFDWAFIEFVRNNYLSVQRAVLLEPGQSQGAQLSNDSTEMLELLGSLRSTIAAQKAEHEALQKRIAAMEAERETERTSHATALEAAQADLRTERDAHESTRGASAAAASTHADALAAAQAELQTEAQLAAEDLERERQTHADEVAALAEQVAHLRSELEDAHTKRDEAQTEMDDLLVLLDELGGKRKADKARLRALGETVSEDEDEGDEEG